MATKITHLGNSGFMVETPDVFLIFDYYIDPAHSVKKALEHHPDKPVVFFVSHIHEDHYNKDIFNLAQSHKRLYVLPDELPGRDVRDDIPADWMRPGDDISVGSINVRAFDSTDRGVSYLVTMPDGYRIFHAGDLNNWHWKEISTPAEAAHAENEFLKVIHRIAEENHEIDVAFFPVDTRQGKDFALGAAQFVETVNVKNFLPMHFEGDKSMACNFRAYPIKETISTRFHCLSEPGQTIEVS